jgi:beta-glucuronidase
MCRFRSLFFILPLFSLAAAAQQTTLLVDVDHRPQTSLNGPWHYMADPYHDGWGNNPDHPSPNGYAKNAHYVPGGPLQQYDFARSPTLNVPGDWNSQKDSLFYYENLLWYQRDFIVHPRPHTHLFLHFSAVNYAAHIFVNDVPVCSHEGGFTPFDCDISSAVKDGDNFIVAAVDSQRLLERVPTIKTDWWNYGGITGDVSLVEVPETYIDDYSLQLQRGTASHIEGYVHVFGSDTRAEPGLHVTLRIPDLHLEQDAVTDTNGRALFAFDASSLELWSPDHPRLYKIEIAAGPDHLSDDIGFRTIEVKGDQILLNGQPIFLRGISFHDEAPIRSGRANSEQDSATLLNWAHDLHCNFVRMAHYPHVESEYRLADKLGILVWTEIPVYWAIDWTNPPTLDNAKHQLWEMIRRDHNHSSVIMWSLSNETPQSPERNAFLHQLAAEARAEDPTRLITSAIVTHFKGTNAILDDPLGQDLDVLGYNEYLGWYQGSAADTPNYTWQNPMGKPVIISEFGAGAKAGLHGPETQMFAEEYQDLVFRQQFKMLANMPFLRGMTPWVLMDFRSPLRPLPGIQDDYNRKGLISDKGEKKKAFYTLQDYYAHMSK